MSKKTIVIGASDNPERDVYGAILSLQKHGHEVILFGKRSGTVNGLDIIKEKQPVENVHTVTLYINPTHQKEWYNYIISIKPERVIFNPGAENEEFEQLLETNHIEALQACTKVMLSIGNY